MSQQFLHTFRLTVDGLPEPVEFRMLHELDDVTEVTDAFAKYVARQEDDFLPLGPAAAVRANRVLHVAHVRVEKAPKE
ncbi:MAG TPA: hypothetical protein PLB02_01435 [Thermoanaerobaculia bacterium]|nr:hypothetical protein [Thermoanaerobaculia bacterium]HQR66031.1 hypothetical protein [Thermoanaerobaculia bacterium]